MTDNSQVVLRTLVSCILLACVGLYSCSSTRMIQTDLYFGQTRPDGTPVTDAEWNGFRENQIATLFKEGCTVIKSSGSWLDPDTHKLITEPAYIVVYCYKRSPRVSERIDSLVYRYKQMFRQQAVLRIDKKVKITLR